jgi:DNA repair protein RecN (Recombination protein N)
MLDQFADVEAMKTGVAEIYRHWSVTKTELGMLEKNEAEKLQLLDILRFQVKEIKDANIQLNEDEELEAEKHRLNNIEKLSKLSADAFALLYENDQSSLATLDKATRDIGELSEYETSFQQYAETLASVRASLEDVAFVIRDFRGRLEFSPERLEDIDNRLAEISRLKRKYGGSIDAIIERLQDAELRLEGIETAEFREKELKQKIEEFRAEYLKRGGELHEKRVAAARKFEKEVEKDLKAVALEKARFEVHFDGGDDDSSFTPDGFDRVEFYFSANLGESPRPLAKVASGGEASRLMLILKTAARSNDTGKTAVFDEIDIGIGGRVAEAVGRKLKELAATNQVFCVTHQPQIAALADRHFVVAKAVSAGRTSISVRELSQPEQIEELARMLAGEQITEAARENARAMLAAAM